MFMFFFLYVIKTMVFYVLQLYHNKVFQFCGILVADSIYLFLFYWFHGLMGFDVVFYSLPVDNLSLSLQLVVSTCQNFEVLSSILMEFLMNTLVAKSLILMM